MPDIDDVSRDDTPDAVLRTTFIWRQMRDAADARFAAMPLAFHRFMPSIIHAQPDARRSSFGFFARYVCIRFAATHQLAAAGHQPFPDVRPISADQLYSDTPVSSPRNEIVFSPRDVRFSGPPRLRIFATTVSSTVRRQSFR